MPQDEQVEISLGGVYVAEGLPIIQEGLEQAIDALNQAAGMARGIK